MRDPLAQVNIRSFDAETLQAHIAEMGQKPFRAKQVHHWLWKKHVRHFHEMTDLPAAFRDQLAQQFVLRHLETTITQKSSDNTLKLGFSLHDGKVVEGVMIPTGNKIKGYRLTACVSSQVGCSLDCAFCATAQLKMSRNLYPDEIFDQVVALNQAAKAKYGTGLTNIVFMGMGEPLLNYAQVMESIRLITAPEALGMSPRRITLSTSGISKMIRKMADDRVKFGLALSLHAADNEKRNQIMSINKTNPLEDLADALAHFHRQTGSRITFEYVLLKDFNDTAQDAALLAAFTKKVPSKVNLIEYNPVENTPFMRTPENRMNDFRHWLESKGVIVSVRKSRGKDIDAACGQLAAKAAASSSTEKS